MIGLFARLNLWHSHMCFAPLYLCFVVYYDERNARLHTSSSATHLAINNNTPVHTEVLWGGGLWWGLLRAGAPTANHVQQVLDVDDTVAVCVTHA